MAQNGALPDLPETVSKPPDGVVLPPKDIRTIIEKTAGYVARNGPVFEGRIRDKEQSNPKFSFLSGNDAYAPFYQWRLDEVRAGRGTAVSAGTTGDAAPVKQKPKGPEPPPEFQFSARMPNISALDLEVVRLTALHAARKGKSWTTALSQREARNFQFDFLRPQHSLYNFFSRLVDQYTLLLQTGPDGQKAEQARIRELQSNLQDRFRVMNLAKKRSEFVKYQESQKQRKEEEAEAERIAYAQIDWHDFVVVETVLFTEADDQVDLPPPTSLNDLQSASLEQKAMMSLARPDMRIEEAMPTDDMNGYAYGYTNGYDTNGYAAAPPLPQSYPATYSPAPIQPQMPYAPIPPPTDLPAPPGLPQAPSFASLPSRPDTASPRPPQSITPQPAPSQPQPSAASGPPKMNVRSDYIPRAALRTQTALRTAICPNCGQSIPVAELEQHLKIELLDPRWKEQQAKSQSRFSTTNLGLGGVDVAANLKRLRDKREGGSVSANDSAVADAAARVLRESAAEEEEQMRKRMKMDAGPGVGGDVGGKDLDLQDQIARIHQKAKG